jgi:hypothetical protein
MRPGRLLLVGVFAAAVLLVGLAAAGSGLDGTTAHAQRVEDLVGGFCNPVASTHPDGTPPATVAAGVDPSDALTAIWFLEAGQGWLGYSPDVPVELNDLQSVDRLDAIFICVTADATVTMPSI